MFKPRHKSYRKSPGRQYSAQFEAVNELTDPPQRDTGLQIQRPDPRRTRQLTRRNILAGKSRATAPEPDFADEEELEPYVYNVPLSRQRPPSRTRRVQDQDQSAHVGRSTPPPDVEDWDDHDATELEYQNSFQEYDDIEDVDPLEERANRSLVRRPRPARVRDEDLEDELLAAELEEKRKKAGRRKFLLGAAVVTGTAVAAYELVPKIPSALGTGANNLEKQLQTAFNNGVASGAEAARKDLINALDDLEGFSLEGAIEAAKLTRVAYDVFVSPLVTLAATVEADFLTITLNALIAGRKWLAQINEDSPTLAALQTVLQSWVNQANAMPKKVQTITETDLDGAQAYLRALQRKIQEEQAKLNGQSTPTATPKVTSTPK
jgi:hypothetical protein